jgi:hypothetical protein
VAGEVDRLLQQHLNAESATVAPLTNDEDFLRRISLDLAGTLPTPGEVTAFGLDPRPDKRSRQIDRLLNSAKYSELWASYWTDVIFLRATEQRSRLVQPAFQKWMQEQLTANRPWNEITRELITATGSIREEGQTGLIFAHAGEPAEVAAEIARIFMGIQLSCANCHNHPTDSWKREQFHQLAAFLPRVTVRPEDPQNPRSFVVKSFEGAGRFGGRDMKFDADQLFQFMDRNRDGKLTKAEARGPLQNRFDQVVGNFDRNKDGQLSKEELTEARLQVDNQPGRGSSEHYMPDLKNPASKGELMHPAFFIAGVKGPTLNAGADDQTRRNALSDFVTSPTNPWFAQAFVNRIWGELLGQGFYMPIDDMGPQRNAVDPDVLEYLAREFVRSGHDVKWLFRTITNTQTYQRQLAASEQGSAPFASATSTRLRSDQIYNSIFEVFGIPQNLQLGTRTRQGAMLREYGLDPQKFGFSLLFGYDPSTPQDDLLGNIPQALFLMNSTQMEGQIRASGMTRLARILRSQPANEDALDELYLLVLSRLPTRKEADINLAYIQELGQRQEAFEDIMWSLLNSTEFLSRR